jgi:AraC family transcriptional regulator
MAYQDTLATHGADTFHDPNPGGFPAGKQAITQLSAGKSREWVHPVLALLDEAARQLEPGDVVAQGAILKAAGLLRKQIASEPERERLEEGGGLLAWQARKVRDYIEGHVTQKVHVADLCALIDRSEAHFSRAFRRTFGESPHAFLIRRRLELAARCMLQTAASLDDIARRCGFTDQAHLCKHFRQSTGQTPAAWRRACRTQASIASVATSSRLGALARPGGWSHPQCRER